jgi:hypothetical protein
MNLPLMFKRKVPPSFHADLLDRTEVHLRAVHWRIKETQLMDQEKVVVYSDSLMVADMQVL